MAQTRSAVTDQLEDTRQRIAGTTQEIRESIRGRAQHAIDDVQHAVSGAMQQPKRAVGGLLDNPLGMAIGAAALGFLTGTLAPHTKLEDRTIGDAADQLKQGLDTAGREAIERGKEAVSETIDEVRAALTPEDDDTSGPQSVERL